MSSNIRLLQASDLIDDSVPRSPYYAGNYVFDFRHSKNVCTICRCVQGIFYVKKTSISQSMYEYIDYLVPIAKLGLNKR